MRKADNPLEFVRLPVNLLQALRTESVAACFPRSEQPCKRTSTFARSAFMPRKPLDGGGVPCYPGRKGRRQTDNRPPAVCISASPHTSASTGIRAVMFCKITMGSGSHGDFADNMTSARGQGDRGINAGRSGGCPATDSVHQNTREPDELQSIIMPPFRLRGGNRGEPKFNFSKHVDFKPIEGG